VELQHPTVPSPSSFRSKFVTSNSMCFSSERCKTLKTKLLPALSADPAEGSL